jgi:hypothetical protein
MPLDVASIQLPPPDVTLRLPPKNLRELSYEEKYQQLRRHLKDDVAEATMSVQMKFQVRASHAEPARVGEID